MADITSVPEVEDTGSSGDQQESSTELILPKQDTPFEPITEAINGLAASNTRSMGGEATARLIAADFQHMTNTLRETKGDLKEAQRELSEKQTELSECRVDKAILNERVSSASSGRHLRNLSIAVGTFLLGIAIDHSQNGIETLPWFVGIVGFILVITGWFWPSPEAQNVSR